MFVSRYCEISFLQFNKYYYSVNYLFFNYLVFQYLLVFRYAGTFFYRDVTRLQHCSHLQTPDVLLLCYFAIVFAKYPTARETSRGERKTVLSRMNVRIIGEEPSIILLGHRDKLDKREFRNYHSKPGHDSSLLPRS